jgi:hypothetical protein
MAPQHMQSVMGSTESDLSPPWLTVQQHFKIEEPKLTAMCGTKLCFVAAALNKLAYRLYSTAYSHI